MMSHSLTLIPKSSSSSSLPCFTSPRLLRNSQDSSACRFLVNQHNDKTKQATSSRILCISKPDNGFFKTSNNLCIQLGAALAMVEMPAYAVTGMNDDEDLTWTLIQAAIVAFWYFIIMPPIIMNWLRIRWYRRKLLEMYLQFMCVFLFFPGVLLWAPFLNFRKFPRDPDMKYPWSVPKNPSLIKNDYRKYPFASPEDYDVFE
ncbi:NAD(P)H-quinone oxidoreductase subunit L, chloroplastic [Linum grandiflorum]